MKNEEPLKSEYGSTYRLGMAYSTKCYDADNNEVIMKCKCGSTEGVSRLMGRDAYMDICYKCAYPDGFVAEFKYVGEE